MTECSIRARVDKLGIKPWDVTVSSMDRLYALWEKAQLDKHLPQLRGNVAEFNALLKQHAPRAKSND